MFVLIDKHEKEPVGCWPDFIIAANCWNKNVVTNDPSALEIKDIEYKAKYSLEFCGHFISNRFKVREVPLWEE